MLWRSEEIAQATGSVVAGSWQAGRVVIDSRHVAPGDLFVALIGPNHDAHRFVAQALEAGAEAVMVSNVPEGVDLARLVVVDDTMEALVALGQFARARTNAQFIGVTGSVGKTGAKEALRHALSYAGAHVYATRGNYNNHIGVPLTLANMPKDCDFAVIEMGMNHAGEIAALTRQVRPDVALITAIEMAHSEFFDSVEGIADAKMEICEGLDAQGCLLLPADSPHYAYLLKKAGDYPDLRVRSFGQDAEADFQLQSYSATALGAQVEAVIGDVAVTYQVGTYGMHWAVLSVAVLGIADLCGVDLANASEAFTSFHEPDGRGAIRQFPYRDGVVTLIDDSYNASPVSMRGALAKLAEVHRSLEKDGRKIVVLGDMLELGEDSEAMHRALKADLARQAVDMVFLAGPLMESLYKVCNDQVMVQWDPDATSLVQPVLAVLDKGDSILVKGSHGSHVSQVAQTVRTHLTESATVA